MDGSTEIAETLPDAPTDVRVVVGTGRGARRSSVIDIAKRELSIDGIMYSLRGLDPAVIDGLALDGLRLRILTAKADPMETYRSIQRGHLALRMPAKPVELDPWRRSIAMAIVDASRKTDAAITLDNAITMARFMDRGAMMKAKQDPKVIANYRKLTGDTASILDLFKEAVNVG